MIFSIWAFFAIPFVLLVGLTFNWNANLVLTSRNQVQLDALNLSLCHQTKRFLIEDLQSLNLQIESLQALMTTTTGLCQARALLAASKPGGYENVMRACNRIEIKWLEQKGVVLQKAAHELIDTALPKLQRKNLKSLAKANQLHRRHLKTEFVETPFSDPPFGFQKADLSASDQSAQILISSYGPKRKWPQVLKPQPPLFEHRFKISSVYRPPRRMFVSKAKHSQVQEVSTDSPLGFAAAHSECHIIWNRNEDYRVLRNISPFLRRQNENAKAGSKWVSER